MLCHISIGKLALINCWDIFLDKIYTIIIFFAEDPMRERMPMQRIWNISGMFLYFFSPCVIIFKNCVKSFEKIVIIIIICIPLNKYFRMGFLIHFQSYLMRCGTPKNLWSPCFPNFECQRCHPFQKKTKNGWTENRKLSGFCI